MNRSLEGQNPFLRFLVFGLHQMLVVAGRVPRVEGVEANNVQCLLRKSGFIVFQHLVHVFVMAPAQCQLLQAYVWCIHAVLGVVFRIVAVGIADETLLAINDII